MQQIPLLMEDVYDALRAAIKCLGGAKVVGARLWPEKTISDAHSYLNDCLNKDRPAKLNPEQVLVLLKWAKEAGCHEAMNYIAGEAGYANPVPVDPEDQLAKLQREYVAAVQLLASLAPKINDAEGKVRAIR